MQYIEPGSASQSLVMYLQDAVTGGAYVTEDQADWTFSFIQEGDAAATADATITAGTLGTWGEGTSKPFGTTGYWQIDFADAAFAAGVGYVSLLVSHDNGDFVDKSIHIDMAIASATQVGAIATTSGGLLNFIASTDNTGGAIKGVSFVGSQTGTFSNTEANDGIYHVIDDTANAIDIIYQFSVGGNRTAAEITFVGFLSSANDTLNIQAYDFIGADWETRAILSGQGSSSNITQIVSLLSKHTGTSGSDIGLVLIRFVETGQSNPQFNVDELTVGAVSLAQSVGYADGAIWVDTVSGTAGTENFVNGVADNPVLTWSDALTLSSQLNIIRFEIINGSTIQLSANSDNYTIFGDAWTLDLNSQSISSAHFSGADVSGTATGASAEFKDCHIANVTLANGHFNQCGFEGTFTATGVATYFFDSCHSAVAGTGSPIFDFGAAIGNTAFNFRRYSGGVDLRNMSQTGTDTMSLEGFGQLIINANCQNSSIVIRGHFDVTDSGTNMTLVQDPNFDQGTPIVANMTQISGDSTAADNFETMLDGTGGNVLTLSQLRIDSSAAGGAIDIDNSGGSGIDIEGSTDGVSITGASGVGLDINGSSIGVDIDGATGITIDGSTNGMSITGAAGDGLDINGTLNGVDIDASDGVGVSIAGTSFGVDVNASAGIGYNIGGSTSGLVISGNAGDGISAISSGSNGDGISAVGNGSGHGLSTTGGATGHGISSLGGATSGDGINAQAQTNGDGMTLIGVGANQYDLNADIQGSLSGSVGSVIATVNADTILIEGLDATDQITAACDAAVNDEDLQATIDALQLDVDDLRTQSDAHS